MNLISNNKNLIKTIFVLVTISFLWISTLGLFYHMNEMKSVSLSGDMGSGCLFNGETEICTMSFGDHITLWQSMIRSYLQDILFLVLFVLSVLVLFLSFGESNIFKYSKRLNLCLKLYIKHNPQIQLFNSLREIFSRGILNPRLFALAII